MGPDGISYLDLSDGVVDGRWQDLLNAYWGPLYPALLGVFRALLKPSTDWLFPTTHLVNYVLFLLSLLAFEFFLRGWLRSPSLQGDGGQVTFSDWQWVVIGYGLFWWTGLSWTWAGANLVTPDLLVAGCVYWAAGMLVRVSQGGGTAFSHVGLGLALGLGYLAKAVMFPLALVTLLLTCLAGRRAKAGLGRVLIAALVFLLCSGPWIAALSLQKGRLTFGDAGSLNYAWYVNGYRPHIHWRGDPTGSGTPRHPPRLISARPGAFEFKGPVGGTYPLWLDPAYWNEGLRPRFGAGAQARAVALNLWNFVKEIGPGFAVLAFGLIVLARTDGNPRRILRRLSAQWPCVALSMSALTLYALVHVEARFLSAFSVITLLCLFASFRPKPSPAAARVLGGVALALAVVLLGLLSRELGAPLLGGAEALAGVEKSGAPPEREAARGLRKHGLAPGDEVAVIGRCWDAYWARLAGLKIIAEVPDWEVKGFFQTDEATRANLLRRFHALGARAVIFHDRLGAFAFPGWVPLGNTDYYGLFFEAP
jgi:hypothetical protein